MQYFDTIEFLEPKCPKCKVVLEYGLNTEFRDNLMAHVCLGCGNVLK